MPTSKVDVRARQAPIRQRLMDDPDSAPVVLRVRGGSGDLADPLHCIVSPESAPDAVFRCGAHPAVGGDGDAPCSGDLPLAALAACQETTLRMVAANMGIDLEELEVSVEGDWDPRGTLAMGKELPIGIAEARVLYSPLWGIHRCSVKRSWRRGLSRADPAADAASRREDDATCARSPLPSLRLRDLQRGPQVAARPRQPPVPVSRRVRRRAPRRPNHVSPRHLRGGLRAPRRSVRSSAPALPRPPRGAGPGAAAGRAAPARSVSAAQRPNARPPESRACDAGRGGGSAGTSPSLPPARSNG